MQNIVNVIFYLIIIALIGFLIWELKKKSEKPAEDPVMKVVMDWMKDMKQSTEQTREGMQKSIDDTNKAINERLDNAARVIAGLQGKLGEMTQIGPDIRRLSEVLASPKARGNFGEEILETLLAQVLPKSSYQTQYRFKNGEVVDAMIRVGDHILPIDSKFSLENFRLFKEAKTEDSSDSLKKAFLKDVKKRIDEIYKKYILPQEGTFDFALMYIPSEGVFSEVLDDLGTVTYARDKKVYFVSPNTFYHHLQIILLSLRGQQINETAQEIMKMIAGIKQESDKFSKNLDVLANHIKNAGNTMGVVGNEYIKLKASINNAATLQLNEVKESKAEILEVQKLIE